MKKLLLILSLAVISLIVAPSAGSLAIAAVVVVGISIATPARMKGVAFMAIPISDARVLFTDSLIAVFKDGTTVSGFLRSFFTVNEKMTKYLSIAVRRNNELVAVDVHRHSSGNRNSFSKDTLKQFMPPLYYEYLDATEFDLYDRTITAIANNDMTFFAQLTEEMAEGLMELRKKIERAIEIQCAQVFQTGIIQLNSGVNIDFKRKAASLIAYVAGNDFSVGTVSPYNVLEAGCIFLRQQGKAQGGTFIAILGSEALSALLDNTIVKSRADIRNFHMDELRAPQRESNGATMHGEITCGSYRVKLFAYPEYYVNSGGTPTSYVDPKQVIMLPENPEFTLGYAAVPQLIQGQSIAQKGAYLVQEFMNEETASHKLAIKSAPVAIPVAVDQIYTVEVLN